MICGLVSPKSIGLINREHINQLLNKSKLLYEVLNFATIGTAFTGFCISGIALSINSSFSLFFIEIFWVLLFTAFQNYCISFNLSQMTYFYIICLYLKFKLRNGNNNVRKIFWNKRYITYNKMKNILKPLNSIASEINTYSNNLWS